MKQHCDVCGGKHFTVNHDLALRSGDPDAVENTLHPDAWRVKKNLSDAIDMINAGARNLLPLNSTEKLAWYTLCLHIEEYLALQYAETENTGEQYGEEENPVGSN